MFDISWGELGVLIGAGYFLIGARDLPAASRYLGVQVGRMVGLMQGARARADRFAANNELKQLQNELRSGLRELDAVRAEMATSMSPRGVVGRSIGPMVPGANRQYTNPHQQQQQQQLAQNSASSTATSAAAASAAAAGNLAGSPSSVASPRQDYSSTIAQQQQQQEQHNPAVVAPQVVHASLVTRPTEGQLVGAVAEEVWERHGYGYRPRGAGMGHQRQHGGDDDDYTAKNPAGGGGGSIMLADMIQESLIMDYYDRITQEQDAILQSKMSTFQRKRQNEQEERRQREQKEQQQRKEEEISSMEEKNE